MPVVPFTYNHRRHPIDVHDHHGDLDRVDDVSPADDHEHDLADGILDDDQPVTVADLLDAHNNLPDHVDDAPEWDHYGAVWASADRGAVESARNILSAIGSLERHRKFVAELSPEERAEFDRRTT